MPTNSALASIINDFPRACTFPPPTPLESEPENHTCPICQEDTLQIGGTEVPVKLMACGHVFGMTCLLTWTLDRVDAGAEAQCPCCRGVYLALRRDGERLFGDGLFAPPSPRGPQMHNPFSAARVEEQGRTIIIGSSVFRVRTDDRRSQRPEGPLFGNGSEDRSSLSGSPQELIPTTPSPGRSFSGPYPPAEWFQSPILGSPEEELPTTSSPESPLFPPFTPLQVEELLATSSPGNPPSGNSPEDLRSLFAPPTAHQVLRAHEERQAEWLRNQMSGSPEEGSDAHNPRQESNQLNPRSRPFDDAESSSVGAVIDAEEPVLGVRRGPYMLRVRSGRVARLGTVTNARRSRFGRGVDSNDELADA
ncbi:MAG: hypothetical protein Q9178_006024 [Gyalolechia marmorata]